MPYKATIVLTQYELKEILAKCFDTKEDSIKFKVIKGQYDEEIITCEISREVELSSSNAWKTVLR